MELFVESKLQSRKGQVSSQSGFVTEEERSQALLSINRFERVVEASVVVSRVEVGVVVSPLKLQTGLEHLGWHVPHRRHQVTQKSTEQMHKGVRSLVVGANSFCGLIGTEKHASCRERT